MLEKVLARHHNDLKRAFAEEAVHALIGLVEQELLAQAASLSQTEQLRQVRRLEAFLRVQELSAQG
jgi:hypothetical protein